MTKMNRKVEMNEETPNRLKFLLDRAKDGQTFYVNNIRHYFSVGGALMESSNKIVEYSVLGNKYNKFYSFESKMTIYDFCNPNCELSLEPLNFEKFVELNK